MFFFRLRRTWNEEMSRVPDACKDASWKEKYFRLWSASQKSGSTMQDRIPWMSYLAIDLLKKFVTEGKHVFEYGGGGSTLFFTDRKAHVVTVEHNEEWFRKLELDMKSQGIKNWEGHLIREEAGTEEGAHIGDPQAYISDDENYRGKNFRAYASYIDRFPENKFDLIVVDGRARPSCTQHAIPKLKPGGWLIIDNSDRDYYLDAFRETLTEQFETISNCLAPTPYCTWFTQTGIWQKK